MLYSADIVENEEEFVKCFKSLSTTKECSEALVQYYMTNGNLPHSILKEMLISHLRGRYLNLGDVGEFEYELGEVYFKIHFFQCYDEPYLDVVSIQVKREPINRKAEEIKEKVRALQAYSIFSEDLIQKLYNSIEYAVKKGHI